MPSAPDEYPPAQRHYIVTQQYDLAAMSVGTRDTDRQEVEKAAETQDVPLPPAGPMSRIRRVIVRKSDMYRRRRLRILSEVLCSFGLGEDQCIIF